MVFLLPLLPSLLLLSLMFSFSGAYAVAPCNRSCGTSRVPYPFGFSSGCQIPLNCSVERGGPQIGKFKVNNFTSNSLLLDVAPSCNRSILEASVFFSKNYAITTRTVIFVRNCSASVSSGCEIPLISRSCGPRNESLTCFYKDDKEKFLVEENVTGGGCSLLESAMSYFGDNPAQPIFILQTVELGWWLEGGCELCSDNSQCHIMPSPITQNPSVTCRCNEGLVGDGFTDGSGCQRDTVSSKCSPSKYISGYCGGSSRVGVLIGGIVAGAVLMGCVAVACCYIRKRSTFSRRRKSTKRLLSEASCAVPLYNYKEIERATDGFSDKNRLGTGAYGTVYFGKLQNDELVAVKKLRRHDSDSMEQVMNEIKLVSSVSHPNLVSLLGCCFERDEQVLVYEFMPNGTLSQHLQRDRGRVLPWTIRLNIAAETAKAIAHLHSAIHPPIYHRDIKSSNILLDYNFNAKVADFGLSRMIITESSHVSTAPQGTPGYLDPQYHQNFHLSDKSDVYSFGVVLIEIITALKVVDFSRGQSEVNLAALAVTKIAKGCIEEIIDPYLQPHRDAWTLSSIHKLAELAFRCLAFHKDLRPTMTEVAEELEQIRLSGWAPSDENIFLSTTSSLRSSPSNMTDKSRGTLKSRRMVSINSIEKVRSDSPVSVQDAWRSEQSSPSANSLLGSVVR